ncbi:hypothetical protein [Frateuria sp. STR12]|uniref:hypothetical protein n=1 Tax=Frateuria hangzhouensis TaxID=2995589 RepID=UPI002260C3E3|nr:hypothetical protein [Frateuria sp. STR12]MCX7514821.1 hypothetical protein [Frateuria sp. STR12]
MRTLLIALALALPAAALATVPMEPVQTHDRPPGKDMPPGKQKPVRHHQLITVKFVLKGKPAPLPHVVIDERPTLVPPTSGRHHAYPLGSRYTHPNTFICYGRGCAAIGQ